MRVLTEVNSLDPLGGIELSTLQDSVALQRRNHQIEVLYGEEGSMRSQFSDAGIALHGPVSLAFETRHPIIGMEKLIKPARWTRSQNFDLFWLQRFEHVVSAQAISRWSRIPIVCHLHQRPNVSRVSVFGYGVAHYVATSNFIKNMWADSGLSADRISVVHNSIPYEEYPFGGDDALAKSRQNLGIPGDARVVLLYGSMIESKGVGTLLEAWRHVQRECDDAILLLVGSPSPLENPTFTQRLQQLDAGNIRWFPMQSNVIEFLHASDLVAFPTWLQEGFGRVVIEGLASGRPVISSEVGAVPEILTDPMDRFLVSARKPRELADRILEYIQWRRLDPTLGVRCTDWVRRKFPHERHIEELESVLTRFGRAR